MRLRKLIKEILIETFSDVSVKDSLLKRIPFLKEYNIFEQTNERLEAQRVSYHQNVKVIMGDEILNFEQYNISSEFTYYQHKVNENIFHNFVLKNQTHPTQPKEMDDLTFKIFLMAKKQIDNKLSYNNEVMIKVGEVFDEIKLSEIINEINKKLFEIEEFSKNNNINLF